jgi:proline dehydrogenase
MIHSIFNRFITTLMPLLPLSFVRMIARRYVAGESSQEALKIVHRLNKNGYSVTLDILGEHSKNKPEAQSITNEYSDLYEKIHNQKLDCNISIKPTHIGLDIGEDFARTNLITLLNKAHETSNFLRIDMESSEVTDTTLDLYNECKKEYSKVGTVLQAYLYRSEKDLKMLSADDNCNFRLCKGLYRESSEIAIHNRQEINYNFLKLLRYAFEKKIYVGIATHNLELLKKIYDIIDELKIPAEKFEFQVLYGVPMSGWMEKHKNNGYKVRVYVPFGKDWYAYSIRRLKENPDIAGYILKDIFRK